MPTLASIKFSEIEALFEALGATIEEGAGSRVSFLLNGVRLHFHRPHPGKMYSRGYSTIGGQLVAHPTI